jgi:hypothetical protein
MILYTLLTTLLLSSLPPQDVKVATFTTGKPDTETFESLAFWIKDGKRAYIRYLHDKSTDDIELRWLGPDSITGHRGFKAGFPAPDNHLLFITPIGDTALLVTTRNRTRKFRWEDENADSGSDCNICAPTAQEAIAWLRRYFWK